MNSGGKLYRGLNPREVAAGELVPKRQGPFAMELSIPFDVGSKFVNDDYIDPVTSMTPPHRRCS
jgi:hypothetical protein